MENIKNIVRPDLLEIVPYSSARDEFTGSARVFLDANENPYGSSFRGVTGLNRYPDPHQKALKQLISDREGIGTSEIFCGNGSDEIIDLLIRATCMPGRSNILINTPTYGMYKVQAAVNGTEVREIKLDDRFQPDTVAILGKTNINSRIIFICSPNNPTGNLAEREKVELLATGFNGLIVIDEAYIDFSSSEGYKNLLNNYPNIVVLRTFSKARGMAGARLGVAFASAELLKVLNAIKLPYNINSLTIAAAINSLMRDEVWESQVKRVVSERNRLADDLGKTNGIERVYPSDANFLLVRVGEPRRLYQYLASRGIVVRDRSGIPGCEGCIRITIGTTPENDLLLDEIRTFMKLKEGENYSVEKIGRTEVRRETRETDILIDLDLYGRGISDVQTGSGFLDHMLEQVAFHGKFDIMVRASGDIETGIHHTMEDVAITFGQAVAKSLGENRGIRRYGFTLPMDDSIAEVAIDLGGRSFLSWNVKFNGQVTGDIPTEMFSHFFRSFADSARCTLHITAKGENDHHIAEAVFKSFSHALREALVKTEKDRLPSTKGLI